MTTGARSALDGVVVVDFSRVLAGPYATMMLGDFGADVIKIERPGVGDDTREWGPPYDSDGSGNVLQLGQPQQALRRAGSHRPGDARARPRSGRPRADVVVENFRPGTMEKLGLGYDDLARRSGRT